jgi:type IV pilus biogenesis protein CpaD/CtpE
MHSRLLIAAVALALAGCANGPNGTPHFGGPDNFGEANRVTFAAQVIDPEPEYDTAVPETWAQHAAAAVDRYRTDKVKKPDKTRTSSVGTSGSGGGGGGN